MRFGVCASYLEIAALQDIPCDYVEEGVQDFLLPERPREEFEANLRGVRALPVPIEAANGMLPGDLKLIAAPGYPVDMARIERYMKTALQRAELAGIRVIVFGSGRARACPPGCDTVDAAQQIGAHLARWGAWSQNHGVLIALEPLSYDETNMLNTVAEAGALVQRLNAPGCALLADTYHMANNGEQPESIVRWGAQLAHVHVAEHEDRAAPGRHGEDLRPYFAALRRANYDRRISIECDWLDFAAEIGPAIATLRAQWTASQSLG